MFSWLTFPWNNTAEGNSLPTNPRSDFLFPGCFLPICLLFSLTAYLFSQLYLPICRLVQVKLSFPISSVSGASSLIITLHCGICGSGFSFSSLQPVCADCSYASRNGEEGRSACVWCSSLSCAGTVPCCSHGLEVNCYKPGFLPGEEEKAKRLGVLQGSK